MRRVTLFLLLNGLLATGHGWHNNYDEPLHFKCPSGESVSSIKSQNNNYYEDRRWEFSCRYTYGLNEDCFLSLYVNEFDKSFSFQCPEQYVITGMSSYHSNHHEDRRWQFYCCKSQCVSGNCQWTSYVNPFDEYFQWNLPPYNVLVGAESYHQDFQEDRRWKYKYCVQQCL